MFSRDLAWDYRKHRGAVLGSMRVLAHVQTFNDADIIDRPIEALLQQTRPVEGILVVDNASIDGTLDQPSVKNATVLRHQQNLGTSGAVVSGLRFALEQDYDWIWVFDCDSVPEPDALEKLLDLYASFSPRLQEETAVLSCLPYNVSDGAPMHGYRFDQRGSTRVALGPEQCYYPYHFNIWSGCLYRLAAVRRVGLPNPDYVLDWGEGEYGYRLMKAGYKAFIRQDAVLHHNIRGYASVTPVEVKRGAATVIKHEFSPIRCYYSCRNIFYFTLYDSAEMRYGMLCSGSLFVLVLTLKFVLRPRDHGKQIRACFRGIWHGLTGNIAARY
jgi:rhamnosyltransferase